jgi:hypothetical protein
MAFALIFAGLLLTVSAVRGTHSDLFALVKSDFTGSGNFLYWLAVVLIIGSIGYIKALAPMSKAFLVLIVLVLVVTKGDPTKSPGGGLFAQLVQGIGSSTAPGSAATPASGAAAGSTAAPATGSTLPTLAELGTISI